MLEKISIIIESIKTSDWHIESFERPGRYWKTSTCKFKRRAWANISYKIKLSVKIELDFLKNNIHSNL